MTWNVGGNLNTGYTPPISPSIGGDLFPPASALYPTGWFSAEVGGATIYNWISYLQPSGWLSSDFTGPHIRNTSDRLAPTGWQSSAFGGPSIANLTQTAAATGIAPTVVVGAPQIMLWMQYLSPTGLTPQSIPAPAIINRNTTLFVVGFESSTLPTHDISHWVRYILPSTFISSTVAAATTENRNKTLFASGAVSSVVSGGAVVRNYNQQLLVAGLASQAFGTTKVELANRYLQVSPIAPGIVPTAHSVTHFVQYADLAGRGVLSLDVGTPAIAFRVRYLQPGLILSMVFGAHNIAPIRNIQPTGWLSSVVPDEHDLQINLQRLRPTGWASGTAGQSDVRNRTLFITPFFWTSSEFGQSVVFNHTQYLRVQPYMNTNDPTTQWPEYGPFVINRNRTIRPSGWSSSRIRELSNDIRNAADPIVPSGLDATLWGSTLIAYRNREVAPTGWGSSGVGAWTQVYSNTQWLRPQGWSHTGMGRPDSVLNRNRGLRHIFPYGGSLIGTPIVGDGVRAISTLPMAPSLVGRVSMPEVRHNPFPIVPPSIHNPRQFGAHYVEERFTIIYPRSTNVFSTPRVGEPIVANRNRAIHPHPTLSEGFGLTRVFNYTQTLELGAGDMLRFGPMTAISFRTRRIVQEPTELPVIPLHRIQNTDPDPPFLQRIYLQFNSLNYGFDSLVMGVFSLNQQAISPVGFEAMEIGRPAVTINQIRPPPIVDLDQLGTPIVIFTQYVYSEALKPTSDDPPNTIRHRVSPHTVYAPSGDQATAQTRSNHPVANPTHIIDRDLHDVPNQQVRPPTVSNRNRSTGPASPWVSSVFGNAVLTQRPQYIHPTGLRPPPVPRPVFLGVAQMVSLDETAPGIFSEQVGGHTVAHPPVYQMPEPAGFVATLFGESSVELFNRTVSPTGIEHRGNPQQNLTSPWGLPMIGTTRWFAFQGFDAARFGVTSITYRHRQVYPQGWDEFATQQKIIANHPRDRLRVRRVGPSGLTNVVLFVSSIYRETPGGITSSSAFGAPWISHHTQHVGARGFRREVFGTPSVAMA